MYVYAKTKKKKLFKALYNFNKKKKKKKNYKFISNPCQEDYYAD